MQKVTARAGAASHTFCRVTADVPGQISSLPEGLPTEVTAKGFLSGVDLHVSGQVVPTAEAHLADGAGVGFDSRVGF